MKKKIIVGIMALSFCFVALSAVQVRGEESDIREEMAALEAMLQEIAERLGTTTDDTPAETVSIEGVPTDFRFNQNLSQGSRGTAVRYLQIVLNADPDTRLAQTGPGSPGNETEYFGPITRAAVNKFQSKYASEILNPIGLTSPTGFVGTQTRAKLNSILSEGVTERPPVDNAVMEALKEISEAVKELSARVDALYRTPGEEGDLSVSLRSDIRNVSVRPNQTKDVAMFRMEADDSDIDVQRVDIYVTGGTMTEFRGDVDKMALKIDGDKVKELDINRDTVGRDDKYIRFSGLEIEVPADGYEDLVISITAADKSTFTNTSYTVGPTGSNAIRGVDGAGISVYASSASGRSFDLDHETTGVLTIKDNDSPKEGVVQVDEDDNTEVELLSFELVVKDSDIELETLRVELEADDHELEDIFEDVLLYQGNTLIDVQSVDIKEDTDGKEGYVVFDVQMDIDEGEELTFTVVIDAFGMDMDTDGDKVGAKIRADILEDENEGIAYAYDSDKSIDLKGDLEGDYQALYPTFPEFAITDHSIEANDDRDRANAYIVVDIEAIEGDITLTNITFTNTHWDVVVELDGNDVYDGSWIGTSNDSTISRNRTKEMEVLGVYNADATNYGWVRLAIESIEWEDEKGNDFIWTASEYDFIEALRTGRVYLSQQTE